MPAKRSTTAPRPPRFRDSGDWLACTRRTLVECPACRGCAEIRDQRAAPALAKALRMVCARCGHFEELSGTRLWPRPGKRGVTVLGLPLWLQTPCRGRILWAYGGAHLGTLRAFVQATDRARGRTPDGGMATRSLIGMLPRWLISAKSRPHILRALTRLEKKLERINP